MIGHFKLGTLVSIIKLNSYPTILQFQVMSPMNKVMPNIEGGAYFIAHVGGYRSVSMLVSHTLCNR